jgi:hypothetical protein
MRFVARHIFISSDRFFCVSGLAIWHDNAIVWLPSHSVFCQNRLKNIHAIKAYRDCAGDFDILHARGPAGSSSFHWQKNLDGKARR